VAGVKTLLHSVYDQPDADSVHAQYDRVIDAMETKLPKVAEHLDAARADLLAFTAFPKQIWRQIWSNNPQELIRPSAPDQPLVVDSSQRSRRWRWSVSASVTRWWRAASSSQPRSRASASRAWMSVRCASSAPRNSGPVTKLSQVSQMLA